MANQDKNFEVFFKDAASYACSKGYEIKELKLFKQVVRSFYFCAQNEYEKILKSIELNQQNKINNT